MQQSSQVLPALLEDYFALGAFRWIPFDRAQIKSFDCVSGVQLVLKMKQLLINDNNTLCTVWFRKQPRNVTYL
jgi:hypothetical protein